MEEQLSRGNAMYLRGLNTEDQAIYQLLFLNLKKIKLPDEIVKTSYQEYLELIGLGIQIKNLINENKLEIYGLKNNVLQYKIL
jgi:hypothetical protein